MTVLFNVGEIQHVKLRIYSCKNEDFEIQNATYELTENGKEEAEAKGSPIIYDHIIDTLIAPQNKGAYKLKITYNIADETLIEIVDVRVV